MKKNIDNILPSAAKCPLNIITGSSTFLPELQEVFYSEDNIALINSDESAVTIGFYGNVNADNAPAVKASAEALRNDNPQGRLIFDFSELEYISSAGLRAILHMAKKEIIIYLRRSASSIPLKAA